MTLPSPLPPSRPATRRRWTKRLLALALSLALVEAILQVATAVSPGLRAMLVPDAVPMEVVDPVFGSMPNPRLPGHDAWGFRNERVPEQADVVALGDSQTYGTGVRASSAWPAVLAERRGWGVYGMAFGGWGPVKQRAVLAKALGLRPGVVVVALYLGNDFADAYRRTYLEDAHTDLRSTDPAVLDALAEANARTPLYATVDALAVAEGREDRTKAWLKDLSRRVRLVGATRKIRDLARARGELTGEVSDDEWNALESDARGSGVWAYASGRTRTVFTVARRAMALDVDDARVVEGARLSLAAIEDMHRRAGGASASLVVVLIPTKESAFADTVSRAGVAVPEDYRRLVVDESALRERCLSRLRDRGIPALDLLPALSAAIRDGRLPYSADLDGHPTPEGHRVIANGVGEWLVGLGVPIRAGAGSGTK
jgi:hypothetical protein